MKGKSKLIGPVERRGQRGQTAMCETIHIAPAESLQKATFFSTECTSRERKKVTNKTHIFCIYRQMMQSHILGCDTQRLKTPRVTNILPFASAGREGMGMECQHWRTSHLPVVMGWDSVAASLKGRPRRGMGQGGMGMLDAWTLCMLWLDMFTSLQGS